MPNYQNYSNYRGYSVKASPVGWRRFRLFRKYPYFVGDKVILSISLIPVSDEEVKNNLFEIAFYEVHPNSFRIGHSVGDMKKEGDGTVRLEGSPISQSGSFAIYLGTSPIGHDEQFPILTAEIMHRDKREYDIFLIVLSVLFGCVLAFISGILLGFIDIVKFWQIWIP